MSLDIYLSGVTNCPNCGYAVAGDDEVYSANYTHNVTRMWAKAGVYDALYMSDGKRASDIVGELTIGVARMVEDPDGFSELNPSNGWGSYDTALSFLRKFTEACESSPDARVGVSK